MGQTGSLPATRTRAEGHPTVAIQVWVDVDTGIADMVLRLNCIPGVRTIASCQGSIGEGGAEPYGPYVMASWAPEAYATIAGDYDVELLGECWGYVRPRIVSAIMPSPNPLENKSIQPFVDKNMCELSPEILLDG